MSALAVHFAGMVLAQADHVASIDLNPVMVGGPGEPVVAVDALVELRAPRVMAV